MKKVMKAMKGSGKVMTKGALVQTLSVGSAITTATTLSVGTTIHAADSITSASDISLKTDIRTLENPIEKIKKLRGVSYNWKTNEYPTFSEGIQIGLIAQEVEKIIPELVKGDDIKSITYDRLVAFLIEGMKDIESRVSTLESSNK